MLWNRLRRLGMNTKKSRHCFRISCIEEETYDTIRLIRNEISDRSYFYFLEDSIVEE